MTLHATTLLCVPSTRRYRVCGWWAACLDCGWHGAFCDGEDAPRYAARHVALTARGEGR